MSEPASGPVAGAQLVRYIYQNHPPWASAIPRASGETLILHGDPCSGLEQSAAWIAQATVPVGPVISLDASLIGDYTTLVRRLTATVLVRAFGEDAAVGVAALERGNIYELTAPDGAHEQFLRLAAMLVEGDGGYRPGALGRVLREVLSTYWKLTTKMPS
jgi:hypothetical protein